MKIEVELISRQRSDRASMDFEVKVTAPDNELELIQHAGIRVAHPSNGSSSTREMLRHLFGTQGDLYRALGMRNYKTLQPDWNYFNSASEGWQRFATRLAADSDREDTLKRMAHLVGNRLRLFTKAVPPVTYEVALADDAAPIPIPVGDLSPTHMEIRIGRKIYTATMVEDDRTTLVDSATAEIKTKTEGRINALQSEYAKGLEILKNQYEAKLASMAEKHSRMMEALAIPESLLREGVLYAANTAERSHIFYIPIVLQPKYVQGTNSSVRWKLNPAYVTKQTGYFCLVLDPKLNVKHAFIRDKKFHDTIGQWHCLSGSVCWGSYSPRVTRVTDIIKVRDDVQTMMQTINLRSIGNHKLTAKQRRLLDKIQEGRGRIREEGLQTSDYDLSTVATRIPYDEASDAWLAGDTWST